MRTILEVSQPHTNQTGDLCTGLRNACLYSKSHWLLSTPSTRQEAAHKSVCCITAHTCPHCTNSATHAAQTQPRVLHKLCHSYCTNSATRTAQTQPLVPHQVLLCRGCGCTRSCRSSTRRWISSCAAPVSICSTQRSGAQGREQT